MANLRWGDQAPAGPDAARQRIIDAAATCVDRAGLTKTTVEDVARAAKVSRATVYRYFRDRDELMLDVLLDELDEAMDHPVSDFFDPLDTPHDLATAIVGVATAVLRAIREDPKLHHLLEREGPGVSATISGASRALFTTSAEALVPHLTLARERGLTRNEIDVSDAAEWILRSILSLLIIEGPEPHSPDDEQRLLEQFLIPVIVERSASPAAQRG